MKFNEKLIELRKKEGLSHEQLGNKVNVSRQKIGRASCRERVYVLV